MKPKTKTRRPAEVLLRLSPEIVEEIFQTVIGGVWSRMGAAYPSGWPDKRQIDSNRRLRRLVSRARTISLAGKCALLKDQDFWRWMTLVPSMSGEIEEIRSSMRRELEFYVKKYGTRKR